MTGDGLRAGPTDRLLPSTAVNNSILSLFLMVLRQYSFTLKHFFWWLTLYAILYLSFSRKVLVDLSFTTEYRLFLKKKIFGNQFIFSFVHPLSVLEDGVYSDTLLYSLSRGVSVVLSPIFVLQVQCIGNFGERLRLNTPPMRPFAKCARAWKSTFALLIYKMYLGVLMCNFEMHVLPLLDYI